MVAFFGFKQSGSTPQGVSTNVLYLTQPVLSFSGIVDHVDVGGNKLVVRQEFSPITNSPVAQTTPQQKTPSPKKLTYTITLGDDTIINASSTKDNIPYILKQKPPTQTKSSIQNIKVGSRVNALTTTDLRTVTNNTFHATHVNVESAPNSFLGIITEIRGNTLIVKPAAIGAAAALAQSPQNNQFELTVTNDTELSFMPPLTEPSKPPTPQKLSLSDLKKDIQVSVYVDFDVSKTKKGNVLLIQPQGNLTIVTPPAVQGSTTPPAAATPSAQPATPSATQTP